MEDWFLISGGDFVNTLLFVMVRQIQSVYPQSTKVERKAPETACLGARKA